jgi:hypothetical protein|tara:strand:- start:190 stop:345 length:156 start_codon:yes stop_codon:yes gene_type:complete
MKYIIITQDGDRSRPTDDYLKAFKYALFNKCILLKKNDSGVLIEINNFTNL